jgi:hypothetical protein
MTQGNWYLSRDSNYLPNWLNPTFWVPNISLCLLSYLYSSLHYRAGGCGGNALDLYLGEARLEPLRPHRLSWMRIFEILLSSSGKIPG